MIVSSEEDRQALFSKIAKEHFGMDDLNTLGLKPFGKKAVERWAVKAALLDAFNAGVMAGIKMQKEAKKRKNP